MLFRAHGWRSGRRVQGALENVGPVRQIGAQNHIDGGNHMRTRQRPRALRATMAVFVVAVCLPAALAAAPGFAAEATKSTVTPPPGAAKPVPATGMGTPAAMEDP